MSAVVSTVALNVQSDGSVAVKIDVVPSSRAPSPLLETVSYTHLTLPTILLV